jgi:hypothetical protein
VVTPFAIDLRDVVAAIVAVALLALALSLATRLHAYRRRLRDARNSEITRGRTIVAELPAGEDLVLFTEDDVRFYYGDRAIDKDRVVAVRVLIDGAPIAVASSTRHPRTTGQPSSFADHVEGIARDRWDVAIEADTGVVLVECGAIRERVSQELARAIFETVKRDIERRDGHR